MPRNRFIMTLAFIVMLVLGTIISVVITRHTPAYAVGTEPTWALPYPTGTQTYLGDSGLHAGNFNSIQDDQTKNVYTFDNAQTMSTASIDLGFAGQKTASSIPVTALASGTVLAVWSACHVVLIDHGNGWWVAYLHLGNIQISSQPPNNVVQAGSSIGYPIGIKQVNPACGEHASYTHVHFALINGSGITGSYVSMIGRSLCGHTVLNTMQPAVLSGFNRYVTVPPCPGGLDVTAGISAPSSFALNQPFTANYTVTNVSAVPFILQSLDLLVRDQNNKQVLDLGDNNSTPISSQASRSFSLSVPSIASRCKTCGIGTYTVVAAVLLPDGTIWSSIPANSGTQNAIQVNVTPPAFIAIPSPGLSGNSSLHATATISAHNIWAVGYTSGEGQTLVEKWNGTAWSVIPSPNVPNASSNTLSSVSAISASNVWAVGTYSMGYPQETGYPLIEHWNGKKWSIISSPTVNVANEGLYGVKAIAANNVWAVGYSYNNGHSDTLIINWNGISWNVVQSPNGNPNWNNTLYSIAATSASDIWAVGDYYPQQGDEPLIEHYDGNLWSIVSAQTPPSSACANCNALLSVTATAPNDAWAVVFGGYIEHWDGTQWGIVFSPPGGSGSIDFAGVAATSPNNVWAVGTGGSGPYVEQWNGTQWNAVPTDPTASGGFSGVGVLTTSSVWAVGTNTLIEYYG